MHSGFAMRVSSLWRHLHHEAWKRIRTFLWLAVASVQASLTTARGESVNEPGDLDKKIALLKQRYLNDATSKVKERKTLDSVVRTLDASISPLFEA